MNNKIKNEFIINSLIAFFLMMKNRIDFEEIFTDGKYILNNYFFSL